MIRWIRCKCICSFLLTRMSKLLSEMLTRKKVLVVWSNRFIGTIYFVYNFIYHFLYCLFLQCMHILILFSCVFLCFFVFNAGDKKLIIYIFYSWHLSQNEMAFLKLIFLFFLIRLVIFCFHFPNVVCFLKYSCFSCEICFSLKILYFSLNSYLFLN